MKTSVSLLCMTYLLLCGCSNSVAGMYAAKGPAHFDSITLKSGGVAELSFQGVVHEMAYDAGDGTVKITNAGDTVVLSVDKAGCLVGGGPVGTYCKK